jgi:multidrug efflux pump subunit AcrA (membrane-fusion protein)
MLKQQSVGRIRYAGAVTALGVCALSTAVFLTGCDNQSPAQSGARGTTLATAENEPPVYVELMDVQRVPIQRSIEIVGTLFGVLETTISAKVPGRLVKVQVDIGQRVDPGELLAQIDPRDYELTVEQRQLSVSQALSRLGLTEIPEGGFDVEKVPSVIRAKVQAENARSRYLRAKQLFDETPPLLSAQDYGDIETAWKVAESNYDVEKVDAGALLAEARVNEKLVQIAQQQLEDTKVVAPLDLIWGASRDREARGTAASQTFIVAQRLVSAGEYVRDGTPMFRLIADNPILLRASIPEKYAAEIRTGQEVRLRVQSRTETFIGRIVRVNSQVDQASRAFTIEVEFDNAGEKLNPGSFASARVLTRVDGSAAQVPLSAITTFAGVHRIYAVRDGKALELRVTLGQRDGENVEILTGLPEGLPIVVKSARRLQAGVRVTLEKPATQPADEQTKKPNDPPSDKQPAQAQPSQPSQARPVDTNQANTRQ